MRSKSKSDRERYEVSRFRALARSLHARIFATVDGRLMIVGGQPDPSRLDSGLHHFTEAPSRAAMPTPTELGFPAYTDGELTKCGLLVRGNALKKWSLALRAEAGGKHPGNRRLKQIAAEQQEIELLRARLEELHDWCRAANNHGTAELSPYVLSSRQERQLQAVLAENASDQPYPPMTYWLARLVIWMSGRDTLSRFLADVSNLARRERTSPRTDHVRKLIYQIRLIGDRCGHEPEKALYEEFRAVVGEVPADERGAIGLTVKRRQRTLKELCRVSAERYKKHLTRIRDRTIGHVEISLACHAMCETSQLPIPRRLIDQCLINGDLEWFDQATQALAAQRRKKAYRALVAALESFDTLPEPGQYESIRKLLAAGAKADDAQWAMCHGLLEEVKDSGARLAWIRSFDRRLRARNLELACFHLRSVIDVARTKRGKDVMERFASWLQQFSKATLAPRTLRTVHRAMVETLTPAVADLECHELLLDWLSPSPQQHSAAPINDTRLNEFAHWLHGITHFQKLCDLEPKLPGAVAKQLDRQIDQDRELAYLQAVIADNTATDSQRARWKHLKSTPDRGRGFARAKLRRMIEEAYLTTALEALRAIIGRAAELRWEKLTGSLLPARSLSRQLELIQWASGMNGAHRHALRDVAQASIVHGPTYKGHIPANHDWLTKARELGLRVNHWLNANEERTTVDTLAVTIEVERNPFEIFLMGSYFNTCLSLGNCNDLSVLANAHDANRQVIYTRDRQGRVLARQLVAVSEKCELIGYHCYVSVDHRAVEERERYIAAMAAYCGRLARKCGLKLTDNGEPKALRDLFWYDDGNYAWHAAAREAWTNERARIDTFAPIHETNMPLAV